jgi:hypothetical protein
MMATVTPGELLGSHGIAARLERVRARNDDAD